MRLAIAITSILAFQTVSNASAHAESFDAAAKKATPVHTAKGMTALFWSQEAACGKVKDDFRRRQCQGVRDRRKSLIAKQTYLMEVSASAIELTSSGKDGKTVELGLRACLSCDAEGPLVLGKGNHKMDGKKLQAALLSKASKKFKKKANAEHWSKYVATRLRAQVVVRVPKSLERFKAAGRNGYKVEVVGYRLYDPCVGEVLAAKPSSKKGPIDAATCKDEPAMPTDEPKKPTEPKIEHPDRLSTVQIKTAMKEVMARSKKCYEAYQIDGKANFKFVIANTGKLKSSKQSGDFEGTPTGICLDKAVQAAQFPKSKKKETKVSYPIVLQ